MNIIVLATIAHVVLANSDCEKDICVSDFLKDLFKNEETAVFSDRNGSVIEEDIEVVDLDTILKEISDILTKESNETMLVKNYANKTYVFVTTFDLNSDNNDSKIKYIHTSDEIKHDSIKPKIPDKIYEEIFGKAVEEDNEIFAKDLENLYIDISDNSTDYPDIDYIEIYKDATVEEYLYVPTEPTVYELVKEIDHDNDLVKLLELIINTGDEYGNTTESKLEDTKLDIEPFIPWITTIFVVNKTNDYQFDYLCDGILVSETTILTGARCVHRNNTTIEPQDLLVILGKKSLQTTAETEKITKINKIITHDNFTNKNAKAENDLAILVMEEPVTERQGIKIANISDAEHFDEEPEETATTAWSIFGEITPIYFGKEENSVCPNRVENTICSTYGNNVALCPSYGGLYAAKIKDAWYLQGVFYGDPADRGICYSKSVLYTSIENYLTWILHVITSY